MQYVNYESLHNSILETKPCKYIIIDNFLNNHCIDSVLKEMNELTLDKAYYNAGDNSVTEKTKRAFKTNLGHFIENILQELSGAEFVHFLEKTFGIKDIVKNSNGLEGAGVHKVYNEGFLTMHKDFNHAYDKEIGLIDRRINLLIYMNPVWEDQYKGHLCLFDNNEQKITKRILPILNRCVIFDTTDCIHGHPEPMTLPDGVCRQSIALYYYTKNITGKSVTGQNLRHVIWYDLIK